MSNQLEVILLSPSFESDGVTSHKHSLAAKMMASKVALSTSEVETSVSGKAECFLAIGEDKNSKLFGVTFSFNTVLKN